MVVNSYSDLASFARANASDPLKLAKVLTAWAWTSWNAFSSPDREPPSSVYKLDTLMYGACGWRTLLMQELFKEIGIESRSVHLWNVPVQGGHVAVELFINGKWMFFDATFGLYFESANGVPLSLEEVRAQWPNVVAKHSNLPGWTGNRADPTKLNASKVFSAKTDTFFEHPGLTDRIDDISGEIYTLFLAPNVTYRAEDGTHTELASGGRSWSIRYDTAKAGSWKKIVVSYDAAGLRDSYHTTYDNKDERFILWDAHNRYSWAKKITYTRDNFYTSYAVTTFDDRSKTIEQHDGRREYNWDHSVRYYAKTGVLDRQITVYDDGKRWLYDFDETNGAAWNSIQNTHAAGGGVEATVIRYDDGSSLIMNWATANKQTAAPGGSVLTAGAGHNVLQGLGGNDILIGGAEEDLLMGGGGSDIYYVQHAGAIVVEKFGEGTDAVNASVDHVLSEHVENLYLTGAARKGVGNADRNMIVGNGGDNILRGLDGNDTLIGGSGVDRLEGGKGNDIFYVDHARDVIYERAREGVDTVNASVSYTLPVYVEKLYLSGTAKVGTGNRDDNLITGNAANNTLKGLGGNDHLRGGAGNDRLFGGDGQDTLEGGLGKDLLYGNKDADTFVWRSVAETGKGGSADLVADFDWFSGDMLSFAAIDANALISGNQGFTFIGMDMFSAPGQISYAYSGTETLIHLNTNADAMAEGTVKLSGLHTPTAAWFIV